MCVKPLYVYMFALAVLSLKRTNKHTLSRWNIDGGCNVITILPYLRSKTFQYAILLTLQFDLCRFNQKQPDSYQHR